MRYIRYILAFFLLTGFMIVPDSRFENLRYLPGISHWSPRAFAQERIPQAPDARDETLQFYFRGEWLPSLDPAEIGPENYTKLINLRYGPAEFGLEGVSGYSKINTTTALATYLKIRSGYQLNTDRTTKSYVLVQAENSAETASRIWVNTTSIPDQGDFSSSVELDVNGNAYRDDTSGAGLGRFSEAPDGMSYCNGIECLVWSGEEMRIGGFYTATTATEVLDEVDFSSHAEWDVTGQFDDSTNNEVQLIFAGGAIGGTLQQINADLAGSISSSVEYYFSYTVGVTTAPDGNFTLVLTGGDTYVPAASVSLPYTAGRHTVTFVTDDSAATGNFTITAAETTATEGSITMDDFTLQKSLDNPFDVTQAVNNLLSTTGNTVTLAPATRGSWLVLTTRKIQGVYYDVSSANVTASLLTCEYWKDDASWSAVSSPVDGTSAASKSLAQDGWFMFDYTSDAEPFHFQGQYLYAYKFHLSAGSAVIKYSTVNAPLQTIIDLWDGVPRQPIQFKIWRNGDSKFKDWTLEVNEFSFESAPVIAQMDAMTTSDYLLLMSDDRLSAIQFNFMAGWVNETALRTAAVSYWNGEDYAAVTEVDGTLLSTATMGQNGLLWWSPPAESSEAKKTEFGVNGFSYKIVFSGTLSGEYFDDDDLMTEDGDIALDVVTLVPAQKTVPPFTFPSQYKNRVLLCGDVQGKEGDRCFYSQTNSTEIWNGLESSDDGTFALDFGGGDLTSGREIYNRYGSRVLTLWTAFTKTETYVLKGSSPDDFIIERVSPVIGNPAPLSLVSVQVGYEAAENLKRNMLMWVSAAGPYSFDGQTPAPLEGIEKYFDPDDPDYITMADIAKTRGCYDALKREYNILFPTDKLWFVYDLLKQKWFQKNVGDASFPKSCFSVQDTSGIKYSYGGIDTGRMMRIGNGTSWDGAAIEQIVETGDFFPTNNVWDLTRIRKIKVMAKRIAEEHQLTIQHFADTDDSLGLSGIWMDDLGHFEDWAGGEWVSAAIASISLHLEVSLNRIARETIQDNLLGWSHRFQFTIATDDTIKGLQPLGWAIMFHREDRFDE